MWKKVCYVECMEKQEVVYRYSVKDKDRFLKAYIGTRQVGYAWFSINKNKAFLHFIEVKGRHRHLHIGSSLLDGVEKICRDSRVDYIEGKFYPSVPMEVALAFYKKNGYTHFRDGYEQYVCKYYYKTKPQAREVRILTAEEFKHEQETKEAINKLNLDDYDMPSEDEKVYSNIKEERLPS